jgi:hypothetical protein
VLVACLEWGSASWAEAQQSSQPSKWTERALLGCSLRHFSGCVSLAVDFWNSFADTALGIVNPTTGVRAVTATAQPDPILRDGGFYHPNAPALYALELLVATDLGAATGCGQRLTDRTKLAAMMCSAKQQLTPFKGNTWQEENRALAGLRNRLVGAGCLPPAPEDPCALDAPVLVSAESETPDELEAQRLLEPAADPEQGLVEGPLAFQPFE